MVCSARIDTLDEQIIDKMKESNLSAIYIGLETGSEKMQGDINKNINITKAISTIQYLLSKGIKVTISFIYGLANESEEDLIETINIYKKLFIFSNVHLQLHMYSPYPKTKEIDKIRENLYLNKSYEYLPYHQVKILNNEILREFVLHNIAFTTAFYDFPTYVRKKYSNLSFLNEVIMSLRIYLPIIMDHIIKDIGLLKLYLYNEDNLRVVKDEVLKIVEINDDFNIKYLKEISKLISYDKFGLLLDDEFKNLFFKEKSILDKFVNNRKNSFL